jgi:hypothetical protein
MIKVLRKLGIEGMYLNIVKSIYDKSVASIILNGEKLKQFPLVRNETKVSTFSTIFSIVLEFLARAIR